MIFVFTFVFLAIIAYISDNNYNKRKTISLHVLIDSGNRIVYTGNENQVTSYKQNLNQKDLKIIRLTGSI